MCLESSGACNLDFPVMTDVDIPIIDCDFENVSYAVQGHKNQNFWLYMYLNHYSI